MARAKQSAPKRASPSSTTATTNVSPVFSTKSSVKDDDGEGTPCTSEDDATAGKDGASPSRRITRASTHTATAVSKVRKRAAEGGDDGDHVMPTLAQEAGQKTRSAKRRVVSRTAFVEIPVKPVSKPPQTPVKKGKGKGKAKAVESSDGASSDESQNLDEDPSFDESDDSGSEYEASSNASDVDQSAPRRSNVFLAEVVSDADEQAYQDSGDDEADEELMLAAAVHASFETANVSSGGAGSSSGASRPRNHAAALRAAAAERRLARNLAQDSESSAVTSGGESEEEYSASVSKGRKKGKGKAKVVKPRDTSIPKQMTLGDLVKKRKEDRKAARVERMRGRIEEMEMRRKLGRKLTVGEKNSIALRKHHPELRDVWGDVEENIPVNIPREAEQPANLKVKLLPFQKESLYWMRLQEGGTWAGGMLADEMGMGKTIQIIALLITDGTKPNLVIAPTVAVMQWKNEIAAHTDGMNVLVWHGGTRDNNVNFLKKFDVVITTYAVLESCFRKQQTGFKRKGEIVKEKSPLHSLNWNRLILDEAHNIKERSTNTAKACFALKGKYKWCLSGTPLQNRVGELYSLVRFLGGDPFSYYFCKKCDCKSLHWSFTDRRSCDACGHTPMHHTCFWNNEILTPIQKHGMDGPGKIAFKKLKILLERMMLRRTKIQRADDLGLPPRVVIVRRDYFSPEEKELYLSLFSDAKRQFNTYLDHGTILNNYSNIFSLLTRMRQMACHPDLVIRSQKNAGLFVNTEGEATVCRLCNDIAEDAIQSKCRHIFDRQCIEQYINTALEPTPACPVCHIPLTIDLDAPALELEENTRAARQGILGRLDINSWRSSSKIEALVEELTNLRLQDTTTKSLVFSQFVNFLDLIAFRLQKEGFKICRLEGTMSPQARDATIQYFMNNVDVTVFLVSLKAGGVALNLTEASRVYLMDSWWNPAVEYQAMDRIHRLGQHRPVKAIKLVIQDSIESRIVQLQEKKSAMVDATLSADDSAMGRLTPEDLQFLFRL